MAGNIELDTSAFPIVTVRIAGEPEPEKVDAYFREIRTLLDAGKPFVPISYLDEINHLGNQYLKQATHEFSTANQDALKKHVAGTISVASSMVIRASLRAYFLFNPPPTGRPTIVASKEAATAVAKAMLATKETFSTGSALLI